MRATITALAVTMLAAAGFACALLAFPHTASAWGISNLPPGWVIAEHDTGGLDPNCQDAYRIRTDTNTVSPLFCTGSPTYQQDFNAWVDAHYTPPVTATAPPPATTTAPAPVTTTVVITTTTPAATTTTAAPIPAVPTGPATSTVTVTTTVTPVEQSLQAQIDALAAQLKALTDRVTRLEKAGDASWLAFQQAILGGSDPATAAGTARSTWLNVVYQLGPYAPV